MVSGSDMWDEDVPVLRRGDTFSHFATDPVNRGAQALAVDDLPREISLEELRYEQKPDPEISELFATGGSGRNPVIEVNSDGIAIRKAPWTELNRFWSLWRFALAYYTWSITQSPSETPA
jgi:hypothetical protein